MLRIFPQHNFICVPESYSIIVIKMANNKAEIILDPIDLEIYPYTK